MLVSPTRPITPEVLPPTTSSNQRHLRNLYSAAFEALSMTSPFACAAPHSTKGVSVSHLMVPQCRRRTRRRRS